jgi:hypothetical protein
MINRMTGEPILPARTADQHLARYWSAVRAGKIGSPVMRFINAVLCSDQVSGRTEQRPNTLEVLGVRFVVCVYYCST